MFNGKNKAITFSYDDGVLQDKRLIEIFNRFGLKSTFNINSKLLGREDYLTIQGKKISHKKVKKSELKEIYKSHEIAAHTLTHPNLTQLNEDEIVYQVEEDRKNLEDIVGYNILGMAYPCGGVNNNDYVADIIKRKTKIKYARTITSTYSFDLQDNLYRFNPTVYHHDKWDKLFDIVDKFINLKTKKPQVLYIWGHSYEFDINDNWDEFTKLCSMLSNKDDIFYGTNRQILL